MNSEAGSARHWIDKNLMAIIATGLALYTGYLTGTSNASNDRANLREANARIEKRLDAMEASLSAKLQGRHDFMNGATSRVNFLCQQDAECRRLYPALTVPE